MKVRIGKLLIAFVFATLALLLISSLVMAAPMKVNRLNDDPAPTITSTVMTETKTFTQPVALVISVFFNISYTEVISLHESGVGFGVIARAALVSRILSDTKSPTFTLETVLTMFQSGMGWGQFKREFGVHPGGLGLGSIMGNGNGGNNGNKPDCPGKSCDTPGQQNMLNDGKGPKFDNGRGPRPEVTRGPKK